MIFYDFEVVEKDWLAVFIDMMKKKEYVIINSHDKLKALYEANRKNIWVGFNNRHYDQYIMKGILLGMNPKKINDWIIVDNKEGWQYSRAFNKLPMINCVTYHCHCPYGICGLVAEKSKERQGCKQ